MAAHVLQKEIVSGHKPLELMNMPSRKAVASLLVFGVELNSVTTVSASSGARLI